MQTKKPSNGTKSSSTASKQVRPETKNVSESAPASEPAELEKDGAADPTNPPAPADAQDADGVVNTQAPCPGPALSDPDSIKVSITDIDTMDIKVVEKEILKSCKQEEKQSMIACKASTLVVTYAWITGKLLLRAKALLTRKGEFGEWRKKHLIERGLMEIRTSQRYMNLAKKWESVEAMLAAAPNLFAAYVEAGVLVRPDDSDTPDNATDSDESEEDGDQGDTDSTSDAPEVVPVAEYVAEFSKLQGMLRRLVSLREKVTAEVPQSDQDQIDSVADAIIEFVNKLRGKTA